MTSPRQPATCVYWLRASLVVVLTGTLLQCSCSRPKAKLITTEEKIRAAEAGTVSEPEALPPVAAVVDDPALQHNLRMAAFASLFENALRSYERGHGRFPADLAEFIASGYLWLLPVATPPARYSMIENLGTDSDPLWEQLNFLFLEEYAEFGCFHLPEGQTLDNPTGQLPMRRYGVTPGLSPRQLAHEEQSPLPADWEAALLAQSTPPSQRLEILRRRSSDPVELLAIHLYDTLDVLPDRFTNTQGRLPANFDDLLTGNWATTAQFKALQAGEGTTDPAARIQFRFLPREKAFVWEVQLFTRPGLSIGGAQALAIEPDAPGDRRSPLLVFRDPTSLDSTDALILTTLTLPRSLAALPGGEESVQDQAEVTS